MSYLVKIKQGARNTSACKLLLSVLEATVLQYHMERSFLVYLSVEPAFHSICKMVQPLLHRQYLSSKGCMRMTDSICMKYFFGKVCCLHTNELWGPMMVLLFSTRTISKLGSSTQRKGSSFKSWERNPGLCFPFHGRLRYHVPQSAPRYVRAELKGKTRTWNESVR